MQIAHPSKTENRGDGPGRTKDRNAGRLALAFGQGIPLLLMAFSLRNTVPMLGAFFTFDDLQNLSYYLERPWTSLLSNLIVFTSLRRPAGAVPYLLNYWLFGLNPFPLYLFSFLVFYLNLYLLYVLVRRWFSSPWIGAIAAAVWSLHPHVHNVLFNFGAIYELLAATGMLCGLLGYSAFRKSGRAVPLALTIASYLLALNAKETAVVFPVLILTYELLFPGPESSWPRRLLWTVPFFLIAAPYSLVKTLGEEAFWRTNPLYRLQVDWTPVQNTAAYLFELTYGRVRFPVWAAFLVIAAALGLGFLLRNRAMIFGFVLAGSTLLPVLLLPRVWGLFLYFPLAGAGLYFAALLVELANRTPQLARTFRTRSVATTTTRWAAGIPAPVKQAWRHPVLRSCLVLLLLAIVFKPIFRFSVREIRYARDIHYLARGKEWRSFLAQLRSLQPEARQDAVFAFENPPFDPATDDRWCLYFLVWLNYESKKIQIFRLPEGEEGFRRATANAAQSRAFVWSEGRLR